LVLIVSLYLALSFYQLELPGLHYDEAFEAMPALQLLQGDPVTAFRQSGLVVGGRLFPVMTQDYIGALNTYAALPFIAVLGPTPVALRAMTILTGAITLWLSYAFTTRLTGGSRVAGLAAALLLAVDPTFIFWNRQGVFVTAVTATIGLGAAWCWLRYLQGGSGRWAVGGAFLFGLGLYAKLLFLWLIVALVGAAWGSNPKLHSLSRLKPTRAGGLAMVAVLGAFLLGCGPLLLYNLQTGGTLLSLTQNATTSYYGVNNLAFLPNLWERLRQFVVLLSGGHLWYLGAVLENPLPPLLFGLTLLWAIRPSPPGRPSPPTPLPKGEGGKSGLPSPRGRGAGGEGFPFLVIGLVIVASTATVSALWITHFALLMPWPAVALTVGGRSLAVRLVPRQRAIVWLGLGLLVVTNLSSVVRYHLALTASGGLSAHSDAIYDLSDWLDKQAADRPVVAMDWGLAAPVTYLTAGRVEPTEVFGYAWQPDAELGGRLQMFIDQPDTLYLWRAPDEIIFDRSGEFKALYQPLGRQETIEEAFYERSGRPLLGVTRLVEQGTPGINAP
jgi:4-amino-4-deoxy-L-arabinose transferase-like glycosyltransferase